MIKSYVQLNIDATWCNDWPNLKVSVNDTIYFDGEVQGNNVIEFTADIVDHNDLVIEHYGKYFGQDGRWDTREEDGKIIQDRAVKINSIVIDEVNLLRYLYKNWPFETEHGPIYTDYFGYNGKCTVHFQSPVYDWIIKELVSPAEINRPTYDLVIETSFGNLFNYTQDLVEIDEIQKILNQHAHLLDQSSKI